jgi:hypothetical protein
MLPVFVVINRPVVMLRLPLVFLVHRRLLRPLVMINRPMVVPLPLLPKLVVMKRL